jgi:hypothetical protein
MYNLVQMKAMLDRSVAPGALTNKTNETNETNQTGKTNKTNRTNKTGN